MFDKLIEKVFHTQEYTIEKWNKGLTNHNYLLRLDDQKYVIRVPRNDSEHIVNRNNEKKVMELVKHLDVDTVYFDEKTGIKITLFVPSLYEYEECPYQDKIERVARIMKQLHALPCTPFHFEPFKTLMIYKQHVNHPLYDLHVYEKQIEGIRNFHNPNVLCHNDFVSGNLLLGEERDYLIDYEYSATNDPLFDVISFLSENQIFDQTSRERFFKEYFSEITQETRRQLYLWEVFQNILWCYWAMMMYESRSEIVYTQIAKDKYDALVKMGCK